MVDSAVISAANLVVVHTLLRKLDQKTVAWRIVIYCLAVTGITHAHRIITNYGGWDMSLSELLMVQTVHLSYLAWDYQDATEKTPRNPKILKALPTLLEHLAAGLCPSQSLGGPEGHLVDFLDYIYSRKEYAVPVSTTWPTFKKITTAIAWLCVYLAIISRYPISLLYNDYSSHPFYMRVSPFFA